MRAAIEAVADVARWDEWRQVEASTLLVRGQRGTVAAEEAEKMLALRPDITRIVIPDAGHDVHLEQPTEWIRVLRAFLEQHG